MIDKQTQHTKSLRQSDIEALIDEVLKQKHTHTKGSTQLDLCIISDSI